MLRAVLEAEGHQVLEATDGLAALELCESESIDAIISDILMPRMDGYRFCFEVRRNERLTHLPFIFYTATYTSAGDERLCYDLGADKYLRKPAAPEVVLEALLDATKSGGRRPVRATPLAEMEVMKEYSSRLVSKLEEQNAELVVALERARSSEQRLYTVIQAEPECVTTLSLDGRVLDMNPAGLSFLQAGSIDVVRGKMLADFVVPADRTAFIQLCHQVSAGNSQTLAFGIITAFGKTRYLETHAAPMHDRDGKISSILQVIRDVTDLKEAADQKSMLEDQLRESQKLEAVGALASGVAHDFNNILGAILGNAELASHDPNCGQSTRECIAEVLKAAKRGSDLVQQIVSFSRNEPTRLKVVALGPIIEESLKLLRSTVSTTVEIDCRCSSDLPLVQADTTQVQQVVLNLSTNAVYAMGGLKGSLTVVADSVSFPEDEQADVGEIRKGRYARVSVTDSGLGMDAETQRQIFKPFFTTKPEGRGTGIGLAVTQGIMLAHGGAIRVRSILGMGTTFELYFPETSAPVAPAKEPTPTVVQGNGERILYIDDDEALVSLVKRMLERRGYKVTGFLSPVEALDELRANPTAYDLIVTDQNMHGMYGVEVVRAVREITESLPVAISSGYVSEELSTQAREAGAKDLILKAIRIDEYCLAVQRLLGVTE